MSVEKKTVTELAKPEMCRTCKSFFGSEAYDWLCSKCYNKTKKQTKVEQPKQQIPKIQQKQQQKPTKPVQQNKSRCYTCKKKTGLLGVECKCGYFYCNAHRLPEDHECDYNYQEYGKEKLKKDLRKVSHDKIEGV